jgi:raffinose/stachyose/melibiose transport system permease protein
MMTTLEQASAALPPGTTARRPRSRKPLGHRPYPYWFLLPGAVIYAVLFIVPTFASFYFAFTRWNFFSVQFIGWDNFVLFFEDPQLTKGFLNTLIYGVLTSAAKVVIGLALAVLLTSNITARGYLRAVIFFPVLVSTIGVGITFRALLDPFDGLVNKTLALVGIQGPGWFTDPNLAIYSIIAVDVWKGVGLATLIYMAGIVAIPRDYYEAASIDGATGWKNFWSITVPLVSPATTTVVILSLIGGLRSFDLIWATTRGGPGFASDVIASVIYKQYQAGYYGLSTAGNVILFLVVTAVVLPLFLWFNRKQTEL